MRLRNLAQIALLGVTLAAIATASQAYTGTALYSFCKKANCTDGKNPESAVTMDLSGNLFGTTVAGGANGMGTVFALVPGSHGKRRHQLLYSFCAKAACVDGSQPIAPVIVDVAGNLYGTTSTGGQANVGTVFELMPNADRSKWTLKVIHDFCDPNAADCADGSSPPEDANLTYAGATSGALYDGDSPLYGAAGSSGGTNNHGGIVYQLTPVEGTRRWKEKILYSFCSASGCSDGETPASALTLDGAGNLYGTTNLGGSANQGTIFELSPQRHQWVETVLYSFCSQASCSDGSTPYNSVAIDASGNLFGTTVHGGSGAGCRDRLGCGVAYELVPNGAQSTYTVLHDFCQQDSCVDGAYPNEVSLDAAGNVIGSTLEGGAAQDSSVVYELNGSFQVLYTFCTQSDCPDGAFAVGPLIFDGAGNIYGAGFFGGPYLYGTVFELTP